ncbi:MAG: dihydroorotase family protein [Hyphomicrobiales bacterium]
MEFDLLVRNGDVVFPEHGVVPADIGVSSGKIAAILAPGTPVGGARRELDAAGLHVMPGLIDAHMHIAIAGTEDAYATETAFAAAGGFTTVLTYLLQSVAYSEVFAREKEKVQSQAYIDVGFHFGMAKEEHLAELGHYVRQYGVVSFKNFMNFKNDEGLYLGLTGTDDGYLLDLVRDVAGYEGVTLVIHAEDIEIVRRWRARLQEQGRDGLRAWADSKPPINEAENTRRVMYYAESVGCPLYFPHANSLLTLNEIREYRKHYPRIWLETCPAYLTHTYDSEVGNLGKANPPLRSQEDREALWDALADGTIDVVASDHVPRKKSTKTGSVWQASQGFPGTAYILPVLLSEGYHKGRLDLKRVSQLVAANPAKAFGLDRRKGGIFVGADADLTLVDLGKEVTVDGASLGSFADYSLYDGWKFKGWPVTTIVRGELVMEDSVITGNPGWGEYIARPC